MTRTSTLVVSSLAAGLAVLVVGVSVLAQTSTAPAEAFQSMADAERAFARAALDKGIRDAFLEYLADDAIGFHPTVMNAREFYRSQPATPVTVRLEWEPRLGDISRSGDLGWLTGPYTLTNTGSGQPPRHGCYFSIWARRLGGPWKVLMDVGVPTPEPCAFQQAGLVAVEEPGGRFLARAGEPPHGGGRVVLADNTLAQSVRRDGVRLAYRDALTPVSRVHLSGRGPIVGRDAILGWLETSQKSLETEPDAGDIAASGDLGFTRGTYKVASEGGQVEQGYYVRMWKRLATGQFTVAVDVRSPLK